MLQAPLRRPRMRRVVVPLVVREPEPPAAGARLLDLRGETMGTTWQVRCMAAPDLAPGLREEVQACLDQVVREMSPWLASSDISRFNRAPAGTLVRLPALLNQVLAYALAIARDSGGACDATAGALVNAWGFGPGAAFRSAGFQPPDSAAVAAARASSGWRRLKHDPIGCFAVQPGGLQLDLSAIAKGFGVDQVAQHLLTQGIGDFLVEVGGELRGSGMRVDGQPWWVGLEQPEEFADSVETVVALHGLSVATSGDYRRFFESAEMRYCHTIDPRAGRPVPSPVASVSVLHERCMAADALSTALMVMGVEEGVPWANRRGVAALFRVRDRGADRHAPATFIEHMTEPFADLLQ
jgi:thiamine biosynthesis lipoprotein